MTAFRHGKRKKQSKKIKPLLLIFIIAAVVALAFFPITFFNHQTKFEEAPPTSKFIPAPIRSSESISPCSCDFGPCLQWGSSNKSFPCSTIRPLKWQETWDKQTKRLYGRHKRTLHFEVINLMRDSKKMNNTSCNYPEMITYFHIFKNGGTTIRNAFMNEQTALPYAAKKLFTGIQFRIGTFKFHMRLNNTVIRLLEGQRNIRRLGEPPKTYGFTFLRDPIPRFLSSMGQVLHKFEDGILDDGFEMAKCFTSDYDTSKMLSCSLQTLKPMVDSEESEEKYKFYDFHLLPQAFLLRDFTGEQDISIMVMDMKHIKSVLKTLIPHPGESENGAHDRKYWARKSRSAEYTGGHDLSSPSILTIEQKRLICRLYRMDVMLLAETRVGTTTECVDLLKEST